MLAAERHLKIIELIRETGSVQVEELAQVLDVSLMTIRRDLEKLKQEGRIDRCHGGAIIKREVPYIEKRTLEIEEKQRIANKCVEFIKKGNAIYLDAGTTTFEIAKVIMDIPALTIITNDIEIVNLLLHTNVNLIICGGTIQKATGSMIGALANQMMENLRVDIAFLGAMSIDEQYNVLTPTMDKAVMKRTICKNAKEKYLVVDNSKFGRQALIKINHLSDYTGVITNKKFNLEEDKKIKEMRITVISV